jgi:hypothetical protein
MMLLHEIRQRACDDWMIEDAGHFWRTDEPFTVAWCPGSHDDPQPCSIMAPNTWASPCELPAGHLLDEHRTSGRDTSRYYRYWTTPNGSHEARVHDGWRQGAPRPLICESRQALQRRLADARRRRRLRIESALYDANLARSREIERLTGVYMRPTVNGLEIDADRADTLIVLLRQHHAAIDALRAVHNCCNHDWLLDEFMDESEWRELFDQKPNREE